MKKIILSGLLIISSAQAGMFETYSNLLKKDCSTISPLIVKKAMIELIQDNTECTGFFCKKLLEECKSLDCNKIVTALNQARDTKSGTVLGK